MLRKEGESVQGERRVPQMPLNRHEFSVLKQRLHPGILFSDATRELFHRVKERILYEKPKSFRRRR